TAASYCNGPSTLRSGRRCRTSAVASRTLSTSFPTPEVPDEYDNIAIIGSIPKLALVSADDKAMSANCSAVGLVTIAQSPYTETRSSRHMKNIDETVLMPGLVLIN